jgi:5-methylcytosine-specific restriction endonuclease McrA
MERANFRDWTGKCLVCFCKTRQFSPERLTKMSETAKEQIRRQGGIPNSYRFDGINNAKEKHPNWKGGITPLTLAIRQSAKYKEWRKAIYKRDDYTCQICGARGVEINADHYPIPFSQLFQELRETLGVENADNFAPLWDISNGRTLCKECHIKHGWSFFKEKNPRKKMV